VEQVGILVVLVQNLTNLNNMNISIEGCIVAITIYSIAVPALVALALLIGFAFCFIVGPFPVYRFFKNAFFVREEKHIIC